MQPTGSIRRPLWRAMVRHALIVAVLGVAATLGTTLASSWFVNLHNTNGNRYPTFVSRAQSGAGSSEVLWPVRVSIGADGNHRQPFHIEARSLGAKRIAYFEKDRAYRHDDGSLGSKLPAGSGAAVRCWSFASGVRGGPMTDSNQVDLPATVREAAESTSPDAPWGMVEDRRGWPFAAFKGWVIGSVNPQNPGPWEVRSAIRIDEPTQAVMNRNDSLFSVRVIPISPIWVGLLADVAIFAAGFAILGHLGGVLKRRLGRRPGHCVHCGYDLQGLSSSKCPECGRNPGLSADVRAQEPGGPSA